VAIFDQLGICVFYILVYLFVLLLKAGHNSNGPNLDSVPAKDSIMYLDKIQIKRRSVLAKYRVLFRCLTVYYVLDCTSNT